MNDKHHAIVIGIGTYPGFRDLAGPLNDAKAVHDWLVDPARGAVPEDNVHLLTTAEFHPPGPDTVLDAHPWDQEMRNLFRDYVREGLRNPWYGDRLYIYMAGHGFNVSDPRSAHLGALYAANAATEEAPNVVGTLYAEWFKSNAVFREIVLVMDCCRTMDSVHHPFTEALPVVPGRPDLISKVRTFYAYATQWGHSTSERTMDDGVVRGVFTTAFLQALERARPNERGEITGDVVKGYVHQNIRTVAGEPVDDPAFRGQRPEEIVFLKRAVAPAATVHIHLDPFDGPVRLRLLRDPEEPGTPLQADGRDVETQLLPGFYKVVVEGTDRWAMFQVIGGADASVTV